MSSYRFNGIYNPSRYPQLYNAVHHRDPPKRHFWGVSPWDRIVKKHTETRRWYGDAPFYAGTKHFETPRVLLDRDVWATDWDVKKHLPEKSRWERVANGKRVTSDRWALVEEDGEMLKVNWKLYSERVNAELQATMDNLPQYSLRWESVPHDWKKQDVANALIRGLSVREAMAQTKLSGLKGHAILYRMLEVAQKGAEAKGLDKDRLRVAYVEVDVGERDKQADIKSRGYMGWRTKKSSIVHLTVVEDPEMELPDRSAIPFTSQLALKAAGIATEPTVLDVPAITADGI